MALENIIGHQRAMHILRGCIRKNRVPHALLFAGDEGIGKYLTAVNFAKALNCLNDEDSGIGENDKQEVDSCDSCPSCKKIDKGNHPDLSIIRPGGDAGQITVSAIRDLQESLTFKPFEGRWKVAIIDNADRLNQSAANAFLQTLEEPTRQSVIILVSSRPEMLLATIRSRCQRIHFSPLPLEAVCRLIKERLDSGDDEAHLLSAFSGGRPGVALNEDLIGQRERSFARIRQMLDRADEDVWESREAMEEWFEWIQVWLRDIAIFKATGSSDMLINRDREEEIRMISGRAVLRDILLLARDLYNIRGRLYFNLNKQITFNYTGFLLREKLGIVKKRYV